MRLLDAFPGDAVRGGDLQSGQSTPLREFEPIHQDRWGTAYRGERVLATGVWLQDVSKPEGEVCFLESSVRAMGQMVGMVPPERLAEAEAELERARAHVIKLEAELASLTVVDTVVKRAVASALEEITPALVGLEEKPEPILTPQNVRADVLPEGSVAPPTDAELEAAAAPKRRR